MSPRTLRLLVRRRATQKQKPLAAGTAAHLAWIDWPQLAAGVVADPDTALLQVGKQAREYPRALLILERRAFVASEKHDPLLAVQRLAFDVLHDDVAVAIGLGNG